MRIFQRYSLQCYSMIDNQGDWLTFEENMLFVGKSLDILTFDHIQHHNSLFLIVRGLWLGIY